MEKDSTLRFNKMFVIIMAITWSLSISLPFIFPSHQEALGNVFLGVVATTLVCFFAFWKG